MTGLEQLHRLEKRLAKLPEEPGPRRLCGECGERPVNYRGLGVCRRCYLRRARQSNPALYLARGRPCRHAGCIHSGRGRSGWCRQHYSQRWHQAARWRRMLITLDLGPVPLDEAAERVRRHDPVAVQTAARMFEALAARRMYLSPYVPRVRK